MTSARGLIAELQLPPGSPPLTVETHLQTLPFGQLRWEDFEKLCLRLAHSDHEIEDARAYGVRGQAQHGIDLFARRAGTAAYTVYQCKKVDEFGPADITAAVTKFLNGPWAERADRFVLCTAVSMAPTQLTERTEEEKARLAKSDVTLVLWDAPALSLMLKADPELVDDFFGRAAVAAFCGHDAAHRLGRRLDGKLVAEYRERLRALYSAAFDQLDPGLPIPPGVSDAPVDLIRRYVVPDVTEETLALSADPGGDPGTGREAAGPGEASGDDDPLGATGTPKSGRAATRPRLRQTLGAWLAGAQRCLLVGGTGAGKSTALRFVALDILSETPQLTAAARHWGGRLPVWVPFPYWTSLLADERDVSLTECVRRWLAHYGHPNLWPLVEQALGDDRLLLIVDGLDEWATEAAARDAAHQLQVFVQARGVPVLAAGRPPGTRRLELRGGRWSVAEVAELDARQQRKVARIWTAARLEAGEPPPAPGSDLDTLADQEANRFIDQVRASPHLDQLAQTPMMLMLLLYLHFRNANLPSDRFDAYEKVISHLLEDHPAARSLAALSRSDPPLPPAQARQALASLAYRIQTDHPGGTIERDLAVSYVEEALGSAGGTSLGLAAEDAGPTARGIVAAAEGGFGLLTRTGAGTVRFFHRAIQEHLAAAHITRVPFRQQQSLVTQYGADPQWEQVILSLLWLARRPSETEALLEALPDPVAGPSSEQLERIRAEVAFGPFDTSAQWAQDAARQAIATVEQGERPAHQAQILDRVLAGTGNARTSSHAADAVSRWAYNRAGSRTAAVWALAAWPRAPETWSTLSGALCDNDQNVQHAAGRVIAQVYGGDAQARDYLLTAAKTSQRPAVRAAALDAITLGWPDEPELQELVAKARASAAIEMNIAAIDYAVRRGTAPEEDLTALVPLISGGSFRPSNGWIDSVPTILARGWAGHEGLRDMCLEGAMRGREYGRGVRKSIATALLSAAFPGDDQVAAWVAAELDDAEHPFLMAMHPQTWRSIADGFRDHPVVAEAALRWLPQRKFHDSEVSLLALAVRTPAVRDLLIAQLPVAGFPHWQAGSLLEGWGMGDDEAARALRDLACSRSPGRAERIAHLIPQIIDDADEARALLTALLRDPNAMRTDLIIAGLAQLSDPGDADEIVAAAESRRNGGIGDPLASLIRGFPRHRRVRELAESALGANGAPVATIAEAYATDPGMRQSAAAALLPTSPRLRARLIRALARRPLADAATTALLERFDSEQDGDVKVLAAAAWAARLQGEPAAAAHAVERLAGQLQAHGLDHEERRRAALAALLALGRADVFVSAGEGSDTPLVAPDLLHREIEFMRLIAEHWDALTSLLGDQLPSRISHRGESNEFWASMCTVAVAYPAVQPDVLRAIDADPSVAATTQALEFAAAVRAGSPALLDQLFLAIDAADGPAVNRRDLETALCAADIVARQFGGDPEVAARLAGTSLSWWELGRVAALCRGWADGEAIRDLRRQSGRPAETWCGRELLYATLPATQLIPELRKDIAEMIQSRSDEPSLVTGPLAARLRRDPDAAGAFSDALTELTDPVLKAAIPTALALASVLTEEAADWCRGEVARQSASMDPELGFDLQTAAVRGVAVTLTDILLGG